MTDPVDGGARPAPGFAGVALAVLSAGTFGLSGIFASALISAGWSPAAAALARLGGGAILLAVPAVMQLRGRWVLLRREAGKVVIYGLVAIAGGQLFYFNAIESIPIGLAVLLEYLGVVLASDRRPVEDHVTDLVADRVRQVGPLVHDFVFGGDHSFYGGHVPALRPGALSASVCLLDGSVVARGPRLAGCPFLMSWHAVLPWWPTTAAGPVTSPCLPGGSKMRSGRWRFG